MKKVTSILFAGFFAVALIACGGEKKKDDKKGADSTKTEAPAEEPAEEPVVEPTVEDTTAAATEAPAETK